LPKPKACGIVIIDYFKRLTEIHQLWSLNATPSDIWRKLRPPKLDGTFRYDIGIQQLGGFLLEKLLIRQLTEKLTVPHPPKRTFDCVDVNHEANLSEGG